MFYCAQALLLTKGLNFSKHSAVIAAFGKELAKTGVVPAEFHRHLIEAAEIREEGDCDFAATVDKHDCDLHLQRADAFVQGTEKILRG